MIEGEKNPGWRRAPEDLGFGSGFATCLFYDLNKSFKRSGLQPFPEVKGSGPTIKKSPFSSGAFCCDGVYHTEDEDMGDSFLGIPPQGKSSSSSSDDYTRKLAYHHPPTPRSSHHSL